MSYYGDGWPYPFPPREVLRRGAELAARRAEEEQVIANEQKRRRRLRLPAICGYCGQAMPCVEHNDLPQSDAAIYTLQLQHHEGG